LLFSQCFFCYADDNDAADDNIWTFFADYTTVIIASSVLGAIAFVALVVLFQFVRRDSLFMYSMQSRNACVSDDNGSAGHGSSGSTNLSGSRGSRVSTHDPLTHDQVNKIPRTGYFVALMMFDFESTFT